MTSLATLAQRALTDHPHYRYRGCAPDPDQPTQAAGDPDVALDAWLPYTGDGPEPQKERYAREKAAIAICERCPVLAACRTYANSTLTDPAVDGANGVRLVEPEGIWGGQRSLDRHRALIARRTADHAVTERSLAEARTAQKQAVLAALAAEVYEDRVAARACMDVRTANWHRASLCSLLGLDKETATRDELLEAALAHDVMPAGVRIVWDGLWPTIAAPTTDGARQRRITPHIPAAVFTRRPRPARTRTTGPAAGPGRISHRPTAGGRRRHTPGPRHLRLLTPRPMSLPLPAPVLEPAA
ncbi:hypothetical protein ACPB9J_33395 [Streptomyces lavendulocolor]|uniref:hypothetical protein n=1 Tax=Streptomyces lavendulocolor TaxID=67316 RepID=UPI003C2FD06A